MANFATVKLGNNVAAVVLGEEPTAYLGPFVQGQFRPTWVMTVLLADNSALNLTGATFTGVLYEPLLATRQSTAGSYAITTAASGVFTYSPVAADTAIPGVWWWETQITISTAVYILRLPVIIEERFAA